MKIRRLGRTGLKVSRLCLGTMTFGNTEWGCDEPTSRAIVDRFVEAGGNFIDCADVYSGGVAEQIVGRAIAGRRDSLVVASKVAGPMGNGPNDLGLSRKHLVTALEQSLRRLGTDYLDLYQVHVFDPTTPLDETLRALDDVVRCGKVRYAGCSNFSAWQLMKATALARELGTARFDCLQPQYSLLCRYIEYEHIPLCVDQEIGVMAWSPLAGGLLAGRLRRGQELPDASRARLARWRDLAAMPRTMEIAETLIEVAAARQRTPSQIALAWVAAQPAVTAPILGVRHRDQLEDALGAAELDLDEAALARLDEVSRLPSVHPYDSHQEVARVVRGMNLER